MILNAIQNKNNILGINERNYGYVNRYNPPHSREIANDKLLTKDFLAKAEVPTTKTIDIIRSRKQLDSFKFDELPKSFVIKPVNGAEGGGIEIIFNRDKFGNYVASDGQRLSQDALRGHIADILEGRYSRTDSPDRAFIEERVQPHSKFRPYIYRGTPDVRVLVFRGIPVMGMIRWPTRESKGKANLSQGAVGSGIDIATGVTTHSMQEDDNGRIHSVDFVEKSHVRYSGFKIPFWDKILAQSIKAARATGLGFAAIDFLIDREHGPLVVEVNARPGLRIQVTNQDGLKWRLEHVKHIPVKSDIHAIRLAKDLFGGEIEEEIEAIAGKKIIGLTQQVKLYHKTGKRSIIAKAKVDTGADNSSIDIKFAKELGYGGAIKFFESFNIPPSIPTRDEGHVIKERYHDQLVNGHEDIVDTEVIISSHGRTFRIFIELKVKIQDQIYTLKVNVRDRSHLEYPFLLGRKDLKHFLIDPSK
jgi:alpha-L-glutamate ligase-like protein